MLELHVWGKQGEISPISPDSLASAWFLSIYLKTDEYRIIPSSNTNISSVGELPVLIDTKNNIKSETYGQIIKYIIGNYPRTSGSSSLPPKLDLTSDEILINTGLNSYVTNKIGILTQYVLYMNSTNYEKYTRKLFQQYLPFPMMYNQPLRYYSKAETQCELVGLTKNKSFFGSETEYVKDDDEEEEDPKQEPALSSLHTEQLLKKNKQKKVLKESRNSLRCLNLIGTYLDDILKLKPSGDNSPYIFGDEISSAELLLYANLYSQTFNQLPDQFIARFINNKYPEFHTLLNNTFQKLNSCFDQKNENKCQFRDIAFNESPSLVNEIRYWTGLVNY